MDARGRSTGAHRAGRACGLLPRHPARRVKAAGAVRRGSRNGRVASLAGWHGCSFVARRNAACLCIPGTALHSPVGSSQGRRPRWLRRSHQPLLLAGWAVGSLLCGRKAQEGFRRRRRGGCPNGCLLLVHRWHLGRGRDHHRIAFSLQRPLTDRGYRGRAYAVDRIGCRRSHSPLAASVAWRQGCAVHRPECR